MSPELQADFFFLKQADSLPAEPPGKPYPGDLPNPRVKTGPPALADRFLPT